MYNLTSKNKSQSGNSAQQNKLNNFLESTGVKELDDAASAAVNGGSGTEQYATMPLLPDAVDIADIQKLVTDIQNQELVTITDPTITNIQKLVTIRSEGVPTRPLLF